MKVWTTILVVCVALLVPAAVAGAHEGHLHNALGTVSSINSPHVTLKTSDGKTLTVMLDKATTFTRGKEKVDASALQVGQRVSVDYMEESGMNMAHAVKLSTAAPKATK
jgi:hypothetical protein